MSDPQGDTSASPANTSSQSSIPPQAIELATRMYNAARQGDTELLTQAILAGLPPNLTNDKGDTLVCKLTDVVLRQLTYKADPAGQLMLAAYHGHAELVRFLLRHGADPNRLNDRGQSPLAGAVFKKEDDVIEVLLEGGADPEHGTPSALECISIFKQQDQWKARFESAPGRGKAEQASPAQG